MTPDQLLPSESRMDLPLPVPTQESKNSTEAEPVKRQGSEVNPEFLPPAPQGGQQLAGQPLSQTTAAQAAQAAAMPPAQTKPSASQPVNANPELAEDVDLIEKEWVDKAKAIVNHTKDDPHKQSKEINKMKADYIKKRYNRNIQVSE